MITIPSDRIVEGGSAHGWSGCLWGAPKLHVICGGCYREFSTRKYHPFYENGVHSQTVINCPHCGKWNKFNFTYGAE